LLRDPAHTSAEGAWCQVVLTDRDRPASAMDRIRTRFPRTVELRWEPEGGRSLSPRRYSAQVAEAASPEELCARFYDHVRHRGLSPEEAQDVHDVVASVAGAGAQR